MDTIIIQGLVVECIIGCLEWERAIKQKVSLDLSLDTDITKAASTDKVDDCLNYDKLCKELTAFIGTSSFHLIETMAERIAELVLKNYPCTALRLTLNKPAAVANAQQVGVSITRSR
jgi:dihydroneopterin aldolase